MSIRDVVDLERVNTLDITLPQRWARRMDTKLAKARHRLTGLFGKGGQLTDIPGISPASHTVVQGLELFVSDTTIIVTPGQLITYPLAGDLFDPTSFATRPASYTFQDPAPGVIPARPEGDDDSAVIWDSGHAQQVAFTFGPATAVSEWWIVYAQTSNATTETDTARVTIDEVSGLLNPASQIKVTKRLLTFGLARGPSSAGFPAIPSGAFPLGAIMVLNAQTDLSRSNTFDLRRLRESALEPNKIGGCWAVTNVLGDLIWQGHVWAHHQGEVLEARAMGGVLINEICSPGATWDGAASPTSPKIAWLYLSRAENKSVPRLKQYGDGEIALDSATTHTFYQAGVLVLSPVPPRLGLGNAKNETAGRWDMQNSAPIALPGGYNNSIAPEVKYDFSGQVADEGYAICVGFMIYDGESGGTPTVLDASVTGDGWMRGPGVTAQSQGDLAANPVANAVVGTAGAVVTLSASRGVVGAYAAPIDGVEAAHMGTYNNAGIGWVQGGATGSSAAADLNLTDRFAAAFPSALNNTVKVATGTKIGVGADPFAGPSGVSIGAVRLPYGVPLFT